MSEIVALSDADFAERVSSVRLMLVDFWAEWCSPCRVMGRVVEKIAEEHKGRLLVVKLDIDSNPETPAAYNVISIPTLILFEDGKERKRIVGVRTKNGVTDLLSEWLQPPMSQPAVASP